MKQDLRPVNTIDRHFWFIQCFCPDDLFYNGEKALVFLQSCLQRSGFVILKGIFEEFPHGKAQEKDTDPQIPAKGGLTAVVLLAESHLAMHTWPEFSRSIKIDISVCNINQDHKTKVEKLKGLLIEELSPRFVLEGQVVEFDIQVKHSIQLSK